MRTSTPNAEAACGSFSELADAKTGDFWASQTFSRKVSPLVTKASLGGHHKSASFFFSAGTSGTLSGPATTAYQPLVEDMTIGGPKSEPNRLASPIASSTFCRLAKTSQRTLPLVSNAPAAKEAFGAISAAASESSRLRENTNLLIPGRRGMAILPLDAAILRSIDLLLRGVQSVDDDEGANFARKVHQRRTKRLAFVFRAGPPPSRRRDRSRAPSFGRRRWAACPRPNAVHLTARGALGGEILMTARRAPATVYSVIAGWFVVLSSPVPQRTRAAHD